MLFASLAISAIFPAVYYCENPNIFLASCLVHLRLVLATTRPPPAVQASHAVPLAPITTLTRAVSAPGKSPAIPVGS